MFNPAELSISIGSNTRGQLSFVGIRRNENGENELCLPFGFENFPVNDSNRVNKFFFSLYKIFRRFSNERRRDLADHVAKHRDGSIEGKNGFSFIDKDEDQVTIYSKIPMLEDVLDRYDDLRVLLLTRNIRRTDNIDYSRIDKYLHKAVFTEDHTPFIDEMVLPSPILSYDLSDLVRMYCFIYVEIKRALEEESTINSEVVDQAEIFKGHHLKSDSALFLGDSHNDTVDLLKIILLDLNRTVVWKNEDFWYFYEVIEYFLFGDLSKNESGPSWGVSKFSGVWEDMCIAWSFQNAGHGIVFADTRRKEDKYGIFTRNDFHTQFVVSSGSQKRYMRPDLIRLLKDAVPELTVDDLFNDLFEVRVRANEYFVKLKNQSANGRRWFNSFKKDLIKPGMRTPASNQPSYTFRGLSEQEYEKAVSNFKMKLARQKPKYEGNNREYVIVDFKYVPAQIYRSDSLEWKAISDIKKQIVYEECLKMSQPGDKVKSQFCVPRFFPDENSIDDVGCFVDRSTLNQILQRRVIDVFEADFEVVKRSYLEQEDYQA